MVAERRAEKPEIFIQRTGMKSRSGVYVVVLLMTVLSCTRNKLPLRAGDRNLSIEAVRLKNASDDVDTYSYQARLIPERQLLDGKSSEDKKALFYRMDSCFYISDGESKLRAVLVQPIANGISGSYEYLLQFQVAKGFKEASVSLIYQDRYLTQKTYHLNINDK